MKKLILLITAVLLAFSSCSLNMEDSVLDGIEDSLPSITYYSEGLVYYTQASSTLREAPSQPVRDGFVFAGWAYSEDGEPITEWGSLLTESVTLYAVWELDASSSYVFVSENADDNSGNGSQTDPYASVLAAITASQGEEVKIFIDGCIKEDIFIPAGKSVTIASLSSPVSFDENGRAVINSGSTEHGVISGQVTVESGASLTLRNVEVEPDSSVAILASDGNVSLTLDHVAITTMSGGRAVAVGDSTAAVTGSGSSPTAELSGDIELTVEASAFVLSGSNSRGISVAEERALEPATNSLTMTVSNSRIVQADSDSEDSSICPIDIVGIDEAGISIDNTFISLKKNHYAVRFDNIGNEETVSNIVITDSEFNAWAAVYFRACSQNIDVEIRDSVLKGTNYNSGETNDFSTIAVNSTMNVNIDVTGSEIGFAQYGNANQKAASIYYWDKPFVDDGGNSINFYQCTFSMDNSGMLASAENYTGYAADKGNGTKTEFSPLPQENVITFDQASLNSIASRGYIEVSEEDLAYTMLSFPDGDEDENTYYYGTVTCYNFALENGADLGFAGGAGSKEHPYIIENEAQFARINDLSDEMLNSTDNYFYFSIENDLNFSQAGVNPYIYVFRGELDFKGHTLSGVSFDYLSEQQNAETYSIIDYFVDGAIRNLVYKPDSVLNLVYCAAGSSNIPDEGAEIVIENVTAGSPDESRTVSAGTNDGLFIIHVLDNNATVTFRNCTNYYNVDCSAYTGVFLSGYANPSVDLVFDNCDNYGTFYGTSLGYLIGNSAHLAKSVTASSCDNYGALYASTDADFVCWGNDVYNGKYTGTDNTEGIIKTLEPVNAAVSTDPSTAVISITSGLDRYSSFEIIASGYGNLYVLGTEEEVGTLLVSVSTGRIPVSEAANLSFMQLDFIDSAYADSADITDDAYGNSIAVVNDVSYYSIPLSQMNQSSDMGVRFPDDGILTSVRYRLYVYDSEGNLAGTQELADS